MATIAPWLTPPDFLGASEAGARLGLSRQQMLEQADEHAADLALRADELRSNNSQVQAAQQQKQNQFNAGLQLRQAALKQQGLLDGERLQDEEGRTSAISALDAARTDALNRKKTLDSSNSRIRDLSLQNLPDLMASHPDMTKAEILHRFPLLKSSDVPAVRPVKIPPAQSLPPGVQDQLFRQLLANSAGRTNVDDAISGLKRYTTPASDESPAPSEPSAAESLTAPTPAQSSLHDFRTPAPPSPGGTKIWDKATGKAMIYGGDPGDIPTNRFSLTPPGQ
jgi:hypothetical protein